MLLVTYLPGNMYSYICPVYSSTAGDRYMGVRLCGNICIKLYTNNNQPWSDTFSALMRYAPGNIFPYVLDHHLLLLMVYTVSYPVGVRWNRGYIYI